MIKLVKTKVLNSIDKIDKNLNIIYNLQSEFRELENLSLIHLLDSIDGWKDCLTEIELQIQSMIIRNEHNNKLEKSCKNY